jgi:hypothetical protein
VNDLSQNPINGISTLNTDWNYFYVDGDTISGTISYGLVAGGANPGMNFIETNTIAGLSVPSSSLSFVLNRGVFTYSSTTYSTFTMGLSDVRLWRNPGSTAALRF